MVCLYIAWGKEENSWVTNKSDSDRSVVVKIQNLREIIRKILQLFYDLNHQKLFFNIFFAPVENVQSFDVDQIVELFSAVNITLDI